MEWRGRKSHKGLSKVQEITEKKGREKMIKFRYVILLFGILSSVLLLLQGNTFSMTDIMQAIWVLLPYIFFYVTSLSLKNNYASVSAGSLLTVVDYCLRISVYYFPGSSTSVVSLLFIPYWLMVIILPVGITIGWIIGKMVGIRGSKLDGQ